MSAPQRCDVVIVGAGIVGCATAYYLARQGVKVQVLDRGPIAHEQSSRAWGFVRQQGRHDDEVPLAAAAGKLWPTLSAELGADLEYVRNGILVLAESDADEERLNAACAVARAHGLASRLLGPAEVAQLVPELAGTWRCGLYTPDDGHAEPSKATQAFAAAARRHGAIIREGVTVTAIDTGGGRARGVTTSGGRHVADMVLCAAGIGTADLLRTAGVSLPIQPVRACVAQTNGSGLRTRIPIWSPHSAYRPKPDGSFYVGNGYRSVDAEYDITPDSFRNLLAFLPTYLENWRVIRPVLGRGFFEALARLARHDGIFRPWSEPRVNRRLLAYNQLQFLRLLPQLADVGIARAWAGRIDATPDLIPVIGALPGIEGCIAAEGFNGHGFALAPVVGRALAQLIATGRSDIDFHRLRPARFADGDVRRQRGAL
jgi:glycine/D-amino acid oxidase-like deaminating enzyme